MSKTLDKILRRQSNWNKGLVPPPRSRHYAYPVAKDLLGFAAPGAGTIQGGVDEATMSAAAIITTIDRDRVGDEVVPEGCNLTTYKICPQVFFGHQSLPIPIGKAQDPQGNLAVEVHPGRDIWARCYFHQNTAEGVQFFTLVRDAVITSVSIGFNPLSEPKPLEKVPGNAFAGYRFDNWELLEFSFCGVGANPYCQVLRGYLSRGKIGGERISPALRKSLSPLAAPRRAFLFTGESSVSKKYGKTRPKGRPGAAGTNGRGVAKMDESSGTEGGYTVPNEDMIAKHLKAMKAIIGIAHKHLADAHPDSPHGFFYHPTKGMVYHHHNLEEGTDHLARVKADLEAIPFVQGVHQHHEPPGKEEGYHHAFSRKGESEEEEHAEIHEQGENPGTKEESAPSDWAEAEQEEHEQGEHPKEESTEESWEEVEEEEEEQGKGKSLSYKFVKASDLQECVSRKVPRLLDEGYERDQALAIAYSMCRKKSCPIFSAVDNGVECDVILRDAGSLVRLLLEPGKQARVWHVKAVQSAGTDKEDFEEDEHELEAGGKYKSADDMPAGAACAHAVLDAIGEHMPIMEPERREFWEGMEEEIRDHHHEIYPEHGFHESATQKEAEDEDVDEYEEEAKAEDEEEAEEADRLRDKYDAYAAGGLHRSRVGRHQKRVHSKRIIGVVREAADFLHQHGASSNLTHEQVRDVMYHHHALHSVHRDMSDTATDKIPTDAAEDIPDTHERAKGLESRLDNLGSLFFQLTGQKVS